MHCQKLNQYAWQTGFYLFWEDWLTTVGLTLVMLWSLCKFPSLDLKYEIDLVWFVQVWLICQLEFAWYWCLISQRWPLLGKIQGFTAQINNELSLHRLFSEKLSLGLPGIALYFFRYSIDTLDPKFLLIVTILSFLECSNHFISFVFLQQLSRR